MPRGRPKGSKNKTFTKVDIISGIIKPKNENKTKCEICGKEIYCQPISINLVQLTGKAYWHRNCSKDKLAICDNCAKELSNIIDKFIINKNKALSKFEIVD